MQPSVLISFYFTCTAPRPILAVLSHQAGGLTTKYLKGEGYYWVILVTQLGGIYLPGPGCSYASLLLLSRPCASLLFQLYFTAALLGEHAIACTRVFTVRRHAYLARSGQRKKRRRRRRRREEGGRMMDEGERTRVTRDG